MNFTIGTILARNEAGKVRLLEIERFCRDTMIVRHECGHREAHPIRRDKPIERQKFGYRLATGPEQSEWVTHMEKHHGKFNYGRESA